MNDCHSCFFTKRYTPSQKAQRGQFRLYKIQWTLNLFSVLKIIDFSRLKHGFQSRTSNFRAKTFITFLVSREKLLLYDFPNTSELKQLRIKISQYVDFKKLYITI